MSFLSLEKYLYTAQKAASAPGIAQAEPDLGYFDLSQKILMSVGVSFFANEALKDLTKELESLRATLQPDTDSHSLSTAAQKFSNLLQEFRDRLRKTDQERAEDFRKILAILHEAFSHLGSGGDRTDVRMKQLESSLQDATRIVDLRNMKAHLSQVLQFVRTEAEKERHNTRAAIDGLGAQIAEIHKSAHRFGMRLPRREEAIAHLTPLVERNEDDTSVCVALFVADVVTALRARHGNEVADNLIDELGRKEIHKVAESGRVFQWSPNSVLLVWQKQEDWDKAHARAMQVKNPFNYGAFVGTRMATFSITLRSLVMKLSEDLEKTVRSLDQFAGDLC